MQLSLQIVVLALSIARTQALPSPGHTDSMTSSVAGLDRRQAYFDTTLTCNGELSIGNPHVATKAVCQTMIDTLMDNEIRTQPRDHCYTEHTGSNAGSRCCVSWGKEVPRGSKYTELKAVAQDIFNQCGAENNGQWNYVSGKQTQANIGGQCTSVCLSSRPDGCTQDC